MIEATRIFAGRIAAVGLTMPLLVAAPAIANPIEQCIADNDIAQSMRREGRFAEARERLSTCANPECPRLVRDDCAQRLDELERAQPTIVFDVRDPGGADRSDVALSIDGKPVAARLTGTALRADPGEHTFTFETAGQASVTRHLVLKEGERGRIEHVTTPFPRPTHAAAGPVNAAPTSQGRSPSRRPLAFVLGGIGLGGLAVGAVYGILASAAKSAQSSDCASPTQCSNRGQALRDHDSLETDAMVSTIAVATGAALLGAGVVLLIVGKGVTAEAHSLVVAPSFGPVGAGFTMSGGFW